MQGKKYVAIKLIEKVSVVGPEKSFRHTDPPPARQPDGKRILQVQ